MNFDVAVIGGGPAGCAAALTLAGEGRSAAVIDASRRFEKPTETAIPELSRLLRDLGAEAALLACEPCFGILSHWGRAKPAFQPGMMNPLGHGWFVHRADFDRRLHQETRRAGAAWFETKARRIDFDQSGVSVETASGARINAKFLVLATGSPFWPAQVSRQTPKILDRLIGFWSLLPARLDERLLFVEAAEWGWWYLCPGPGDSAVACFMTDAVSARHLNPTKPDVWNALFDATSLSRRLDCKTPARDIEAAPAGIAALPRASGARWVAAGDAAVKLDPIGSSGTYTALDSGRRAALAVAQSLQGNPAAIDQYSHWTSGLLKAFTRQRARHYAIEADQRSNAFWTARLNHAA